MSEETKRQEAQAFDKSKAESMKKMKEIQQMLLSSSQQQESNEGPNDIENADELDDYMERQLM